MLSLLVPKLHLGTEFGAQAQLGRIFIVPKRSLGTRGKQYCKGPGLPP